MQKKLIKAAMRIVEIDTISIQKRVSVHLANLNFKNAVANYKDLNVLVVFIKIQLIIIVKDSVLQLILTTMFDRLVKNVSLHVTIVRHQHNVFRVKMITILQKIKLVFSHVP